LSVTTPMLSRSDTRTSVGTEFLPGSNTHKPGSLRQTPSPRW
jgi:hypothetical protein